MEYRVTVQIEGEDVSCGRLFQNVRHGEVLRARNGWALSPAFDVNPKAGGGEKYLATGLDFDRPDADPRIALEVAEYFRLSNEVAREYARGLAVKLADWQRVARSEGISEASAARMAGNFERGITGLGSV